ncbi:hypothetical protein HWV62_6931 [Athelia sp. TMB]|nr:hypothetical protein HWV62_6931 [Athelia sp. TMB]
MPPRAITVGSILRRLKRQPKDNPVLLSGSSPGVESEQLDSSPGQTTELEAFAGAVKALEHAKGVVAGRCVQLLASPIDGVLDVAKACHAALDVQTNDQDAGGLGDMLKALVALDGKTDSALALSHELVISTSSRPSAAEQLHSDIVTLDSSLGTLSECTKHILTQTSSSDGTSRMVIVGSIRLAVQGFAVLGRLCIEDIIICCAAYELGHNRALRQHLSSSGSAQGHAMSASTPDESLIPPIPGSGGLDSQDEVELGSKSGRVAYEHHPKDDSIDNPQGRDANFDEALAPRNQNRHFLPGILFNAANSSHNPFKALGRLVRYHFFIRRGVLSYMQFGQSGEMADLDQAITYFHDALVLRPPGHSGRSTTLANLAESLKTRFDRLGQLTDLEEATNYYRDAMNLSLPGQPHYPAILSNFTLALYTRFGQSGQMTNLEEAITCLQNALALCPPEYPPRPTILNNLAESLRTRFGQSSQMTDLEEAITCLQNALALCSPGHDMYLKIISNLALALSTRFGQSGQMTDLEEAITYQRDAMGLSSPGEASHIAILNNLAESLRTRFGQSGQIADLEEAITCLRNALALCSPGYAMRSTILSNLALGLSTRFNQSGQMENLEEAITYQRDALDLCRPEHPFRSTTLNNLAGSLRTRFDQLSQMTDLEEAITYFQNALALCSPGYATRSTILTNLASALNARFDQSGQKGDLEEAITYFEEALDLRPQGHPERYTALGSLAMALGTRFNQSHKIADLEDAITRQREAIDLCPPGRLFRSAILSNLAELLSARFSHSGQMKDLEETITCQRNALNLNPPGHPTRSTIINNLASKLNLRFKRSKRTEDFDGAVELLQSGADDVSDTPAHRYTCATRLLALLEEHDRPPLLALYELALGLLQLALAVYPDVELRREALGIHRLSPSLAMEAAAHAIEQGLPGKAVEMLEQGRAMLWSSMRGYRQPIETVRQVDSVLADRFKATSEQLEALATSSQSGSHQLLIQDSNDSAKVFEAKWARQRQLLLERDEVVKQIRQLNGFEHFLQAVPFSVLQNVAKEGPVIVVNVAPQRSDAIIIHQHGAPIILPLAADGQNRKEAYNVILELSKLLFKERENPGFSELLENVILKQLGELLVSPILGQLKALGVPEQSRIWWCPTSALCALPIHAAGQLPNKYISSYTPTLSALIGARTLDGRHSPAPLDASNTKPSLLAIIHPGQPPKTKDEQDGRLKMVFAECNVIEKAGGVGRVLTVVKTDATRQTVLGQLPNYPWTHFACHGRLNISKPFRSAFELEDDPLALSDLVHARLPNAEFAFLAACDSATSGGTSGTPDESLHLAAAVQFCGVRSVVGTLWPMADGDGPRVAQVFYRHMFKENDSRKSAEALHQVVKLMRRKAGPWAKAKDEGEDLQRWANYIHIGA